MPQDCPRPRKRAKVPDPGGFVLKIAYLFPFVAFALTSCGGPKDVTVDHGWVRLPVVAGRPAAAYFTLHGGKQGAILIAVSSADATSAHPCIIFLRSSKYAAWL